MVHLAKVLEQMGLRREFRKVSLTCCRPAGQTDEEEDETRMKLMYLNEPKAKEYKGNYQSPGGRQFSILSDWSPAPSVASLVWPVDCFQQQKTKTKCFFFLRHDGKFVQ